MDKTNLHGPLTVSLDDPPGMMVALPALMIMAGVMAERGGDHLIFNPFDLTVAHYSLLASLNRLPRLSMTDLKHSLFMPRSASSLTQLVDDLERRDWVRRLPSLEDRRITFVEITDAGRELLGQVDARYAAVMQEVAREIQPDQLRVTVDVLRRFILEAGRRMGMPPFAVQSDRTT
jgi:MarR family 2-MHQ and catechol resistance regulon transcriptional repressor